MMQMSSMMTPWLLTRQMALPTKRMPMSKMQMPWLTGQWGRGPVLMCVATKNCSPMGEQITMVLVVFGNPGAHFWMTFAYFWCLGTFPGGLGEHLEAKARISTILVTFPRESSSPFWLLFRYFLDAFFTTFSSRLLEATFWQIWCQKLPKWEVFGGHFEVIFGNRRFLDF